MVRMHQELYKYQLKPHNNIVNNAVNTIATEKWAINQYFK